MSSSPCRISPDLEYDVPSPAIRIADDHRLGMLGLMAGGVAHDLNNILQIISGNLELLAGELEPDGKGRLRLASARNGVELGTRLTSRILDQCRRAPCGVEVVDFGADRVRVPVSDLLSTAVGPGVELRLEIPDDLWMIRLNLSQFQTALLNLAVNARDAMDGNGVFLVSAANSTRSGRGQSDEVVFTIADSGSGMSEEVLGNVFTPFYTTKSEGNGTGLGLAVVREFADSAFASLEVESIVGIGTTFTLIFPRYI